MTPVRNPPGSVGRTSAISPALASLPLRVAWFVSGSAAVAGTALLLSDRPALAAATIGLAGAVIALIGVTLLWNALSEPEGHPDIGGHTAAFQGQAAALVTLQGVVLTLVLTLAGASATATVKVGGVALVLGVVLGLLLASLVAMGVAGDGQWVVATIVYNLTVWACVYGLLCLASALVFER